MDELSIESIRKSVELLKSFKPLYPEKLVMDILVKDRGWFRFTHKAVFKLTLTEDDALISEELTHESAEMIRKEVQEQIGKSNII